MVRSRLGHVCSASSVPAEGAGFNQAELLARIVAGRLNRPLIPLLRRIRPTEPQSQKSRRERLVALRGAFAFAAGVGVLGKWPGPRPHRRRRVYDRLHPGGMRPRSEGGTGETRRIRHLCPVPPTSPKVVLAPSGVRSESHRNRQKSRFLSLKEVYSLWTMGNTSNATIISLGVYEKRSGIHEQVRTDRTGGCRHRVNQEGSR